MSGDAGYFDTIITTSYNSLRVVIYYNWQVVYSEKGSWFDSKQCVESSTAIFSCWCFRYRVPMHLPRPVRIYLYNYM